jgi:protein-S-isoprenylcysteine O-methyltransferase Ste14
MKLSRLEQLDRIYYMRAILGIIAGVILGVALNPSNRGSALYLIVFIGFIFYIISYIAAKKIGTRVKSEEKRKLATSGIFPFIFLLLMFMILVYTGLHGNR